MTETRKSKSSSFNSKALVTSVLSALIPLWVLLTATFLACVLAYFAVLIFDDSISFRTVIKKSTQILLLLSIFPIMIWLKLNKADLGFAARSVFLKQIGLGFALGFVTLLPVFTALYLLGVDIVDTTKPWAWDWLAKKLVLELLLALLISLFEEPVFRGILLTGLNKKMTTETAILVSAIYYAALHFLNTKTEIPSQDINFFSGFELLGEAFKHLLSPEIFTAFLALCAVGIFLGLLRTQLKTSLGLCIGCHACWVWQIKLSKSMFNINPHSDHLFLVSGYDGVIGPLVTSWLVLVMMAYFLYKKRFTLQ